ncbi:MAG: carbon monoxide dehydrogenase subunit G [Pseudomonadota bacterium]
MQQSGEYSIAAPRDAVWHALNDATILAACIPGCQDMQRVGDAHFKAKVKAKIGPVSAVFDADLELQDLQPPEAYTIQGDVKGGAAGFGKGKAQVMLEAVDEATTLLRYAVDANVGGKLAQVGSRLVDGAARKMADDFFAAFAAQLAGESDTAVAGPATEQHSTAPQPSGVGEPRQPPEYEQQGGRAFWIVAFGVLFLAIVLAI